MSEKKNQNSTWREQVITIPARSIHEVIFHDTKPNHIVVQSYSAGMLYLGVNTIPNDSHYDAKIGSYGKQLYARDLGTNRCLLFNGSVNPIRATVTSFEEVFNPAILSNANLQIEGDINIEAYDGVIKGFVVSMPSGDNHIGRVTVANPQTAVDIKTLPNVVVSEVKKVPPIPAGSNLIGKIDVNNPVVISSLPVVEVKGQHQTKAQHHYYEATVDHLEKVYDMSASPITKIVFIHNKGNTDLFVSFDNVVAAATAGSGLNGIIKLQAGDILEDIPRQCSKIRFIRAAGNSADVRFMGV